MLPIAFIGNLGPFEMLLVAGIALLLFGKNLPKVARDAGKAIVEFKKGMAGIEHSVDEAVYAKPESSNAARPTPVEETIESSAPKFEPPTSEPTVAESTPSESAVG
ncbi:MAG: twin-arginine translocase TatA/TatE family subunit [Planctomycetes bacterium]|nr:twin-arginine translocase TatA/TatE family subunit [Planctomycetota bacterium]